MCAHAALTSFAITYIDIYIYVYIKFSKCVIKCFGLPFRGFPHKATLMWNKGSIHISYSI